MSHNEHARITRRHAERLLSDPTSDPSAVGSVLSSAAGPATSAELQREATALAAFHAARLSSPTARSNMSVSSRKAAFKAVAATGAIVALTSSGFALAATGHLPTLPDQASDRATEAVAKNRTAPETEDPTATGDDSEVEGAEVEDTNDTPATDPTDVETPSAAPSPNLEGLCTAFQAHDKSESGKALESAAFSVLAEAAGGAEGIATYCIDLIGEPEAEEDETKGPKPTQAATPTKPPKPTQAATPTGKPTDKPKPSQAATPEQPGQSEDAGTR